MDRDPKLDVIRLADFVRDNISFFAPTIDSRHPDQFVIPFCLGPFQGELRGSVTDDGRALLGVQDKDALEALLKKHLNTPNAGKEDGDASKE